MNTTMKGQTLNRSLLLLGALGIGGSVQAQSSVTMFGVVDTNIGWGSGSLAKRTQLSRSGLSSSRVGFRGVEDLGSGLSAGFWLEAGLNSDDGNGLLSNANNQTTGVGTGNGLSFGRRATVSLTSAYGEMRIGRDYVPQYLNFGIGEPFVAIGVGTAVNYQASLGGLTQTRASNLIQYFSPELLGGFGINLANYRGENLSSAANSDDGNGNAIRLHYTDKAIVAGAAWSRTTYLIGDIRQRNAFVSWSSPIGRLSALYSSDQSGAIEARGAVIGIVIPVGLGEIKGAYSVNRTTAVGEPKAKKFALGYVHRLSKRTTLYATVAYLDNSNGSALALNGGVTAPNRSARGADLGIRHTF